MRLNNKKRMKIKVGFGYDVHPLKEARPMWLSGIQLEYTKGPDGHSDAEVLIHAICDALLCAANMRDIYSSSGFVIPKPDKKRFVIFI